jgi:hypothetical protein
MLLFLSNLADPPPIYFVQQPRVRELHFGYQLHLSFISPTLSPQTLTTGQSQRRSETSEARSPEMRQGTKQKTSIGQHLEFDYLFLLYSLLFRYIL